MSTGQTPKTPSTNGPHGESPSIETTIERIAFSAETRPDRVQIPAAPVPPGAPGAGPPRGPALRPGRRDPAAHRLDACQRTRDGRVRELDAALAGAQGPL